MSYYFDDREIIKSLWITLRAEDVREFQSLLPEKDQESDELLEESAGMEWFANYESSDILEQDDDLIMQAAFYRFEQLYDRQPVFDTDNDNDIVLTTGLPNLKGSNLQIREASQDDPIYNRGYVIGIKTLKKRSNHVDKNNKS